MELLIPFLIGHLFSLLGFLMALLLMGRLMEETIGSGSALAWLLAMAFVPYIAIPLFLFLGGRKFTRMARRKQEVIVAEEPCTEHEDITDPVARSLIRVHDMAHPLGGNRLDYLDDGTVTYARLMKLIEESRESINICVFIFSNDEVSRRVLEALAAKAREGVKVRLLLDSLGCFWTKGSFMNPVREAGGEVAAFMPVLPTRRKWSANLRNHRKIFVFDEKVAIVGGKNIGKEYFGPEADPKRWRDLAVELEGPVVHTFMKIFAADWEFASGQKSEEIVKKPNISNFLPAGEVIIQPVFNGPDVHGEPLHDSLLTAFFEARRRIWISTPYLVPDETMLNTLRVVAKMGRDVQIVIPHKTDHPIVDLARRHPLRELHEVGVKIWRFRPSMLHAKSILVDDEVAFVGSANLDQRSLYLNYEAGLYIYSKEEAQRMEAFFKDLIMDSTPHYPRTHRPFHAPLEALMENVARLLSPLL